MKDEQVTINKTVEGMRGISVHERLSIIAIAVEGQRSMHDPYFVTHPDEFRVTDMTIDGLWETWRASNPGEMDDEGYYEETTGKDIGIPVVEMFTAWLEGEHGYIQLPAGDSMAVLK